MPANSWPEEDSFQEFDPLNSLLSDLSVDEESVLETDPVFLPSRFQTRRRKA
ncbi:MAG: glycosyltransferase, partial [Nostoc sp.]